MTKKSIVEFYQHLYIPTMKKLALHLPHIRIIETHYCVNTQWEAFKHSSAYQYVLCHIDYAECVVSSFAHQIHSK